MMNSVHFFPLFLYFPILLTSFDIGPSIIEINMPLERFGQVKPITGHPTRYATGDAGGRQIDDVVVLDPFCGRQPNQRPRSLEPLTDSSVSSFLSFSFFKKNSVKRPNYVITLDAKNSPL